MIQILLHAAKKASFQVVVVDSRPLCDGVRTLRALSPHIDCTYTTLSGASAAIKDVTRVIVGASALLANGAVLAPAGTAMIAALARSSRVPVIVAAESYKFSDKVQLDAIVFNELGASSELAYLSATETGSAEGPASGDAAGSNANPVSVVPQWSSKYRGSLEADGGGGQPMLPFQVVNLRYDLTPMHCVTVVATEAGLIPPTSVPVLIRELRVGADDLHNNSESKNIQLGLSGESGRFMAPNVLGAT